MKYFNEYGQGMVQYVQWSLVIPLGVFIVTLVGTQLFDMTVIQCCGLQVGMVTLLIAALYIITRMRL